MYDFFERRMIKTISIIWGGKMKQKLVLFLKGTEVIMIFTGEVWKKKKYRGIMRLTND